MDTKKNIIVIGASAGGIEALKSIFSQLPSDLAAAVFIVWHMSAEVEGILPLILNRLHGLPAAHATDYEPIQPGRIYVAPPDRHLLLEKDRVRVTRGPKENRFRPAVDPLFRSAAFAYGPRVIGVVLSGGLDDGSAGLWTIKQWGGTAIVQDPSDAILPSMPRSALRTVPVDYTAAADEIAPLLVQLASEPADTGSHPGMPDQEKMAREVRLALGQDSLTNNVESFGFFSPYACPECHGVLSALEEGNILRFRFHTGHAFSAQTLLAAIGEQTEQYLWNALRSMQESITILNHLGDHLAESNQPKMAAAYFQEAKLLAERVKLMNQVVIRQEPLDTESIEEEAEQSGK